MKLSRLSEAEEAAAESLRIFTAIRPQGHPEIRNGYHAISVSVSKLWSHCAVHLSRASTLPDLAKETYLVVIFQHGTAGRQDMEEMAILSVTL